MKSWKKVAGYLCVIALAVPVLPANYISLAASPSDRFQQELTQLLQEDDGFYFDSIQLTVGSHDLAVDGVTVQMDAAPDIQNNRTMLPIRAVAEAAGATVDYDPDTETAIIEGQYGEEILCPIGAATMSVNSRSYELDSPSYAKNGRTYLPVRAVSEALNLNVEWSQETSQVTITAPYQTARILVWSKELDTGGLTPRAKLFDGNQLWVLQFDTPADASEAIQQLSAQGYDAEPDFYIPPIDREYAQDSYSAQGSSLSWGVTDCGFDSFVGKNQGKLSKQGIVAVVDTGVDSTHPFLRGKVIPGANFIDNRGTRDDYGHGTHVSGTVIDCTQGASVSILPVRVLGSDGHGNTSSTAAGVIYAAQNGADVINLSLGGGHSSTLDHAIEYAIRQGVTVVASAGNKNANTSLQCPAHIDIPGMIVVSAGNSSHDKAYFSNYGDSVDLMAPGVKIKSCVPGGGYQSWQGTSMAAPHASAAAILLDLAWGKELSPAEIEKKVRAATANGRWTNQYIGCGFLNMAKADVPSEPVVPSVPPSAKPTVPPSQKPTTPPSVPPSAPPSVPPTVPPSATPAPSWQDQGWTSVKPQESDTLKITDTRTVVDQEGYTEYTYYHYWGKAANGLVYMSYGNLYWKNYEEIISREPYRFSKTYDGKYDAYNAPGGSPSGTCGNIWWLKSTNTMPPVTHIEYRYSILR